MRIPPHRIERTKNKHSRALYRGNTVIIRLARGLSRTEERDHIESLTRRMQAYIAEESQKTIVDPFRHLLEGGQSQTVQLATGKKIHFSLEPGERTEAWQSRKGFRMTLSPRIRRTSLHRLLWKVLSETELPRVTGLVARLNQETFRARIRPVHLRFARSQWGSCSPRGVIMLNTALLFLPPSILKYVILHELAHTVHRNHSRAYWREVAWIMPTYKKALEELGEYRLPTL